MLLSTHSKKCLQTVVSFANAQNSSHTTLCYWCALMYVTLCQSFAYNSLLILECLCEQISTITCTRLFTIRACPIHLHAFDSNSSALYNFTYAHAVKHACICTAMMPAERQTPILSHHIYVEYCIHRSKRYTRNNSKIMDIRGEVARDRPRHRASSSSSSDASHRPERIVDVCKYTFFTYIYEFLRRPIEVVYKTKCVYASNVYLFCNIGYNFSIAPVNRDRRTNVITEN